MRNELQHIDFIERFLDGKLSSEEEVVFYEKLQDPDFAALVDDLKIGRAAVVEVELIEKRKALESFMKQKVSDSSTKRSRWIGGGLFLLLVSSVMLLWNSNEDSKEKGVLKEGDSKEVVEQEKTSSDKEPIEEDQTQKQERKLIQNNEQVKEAGQTIEETTQNELVDEKIQLPEDEKTSLESDTVVKQKKAISNTVIEEITRTNDCLDFLPTVTTEPSCIYRPDGKVKVSNITGDVQVVLNESSRRLFDLPPDVYEVKISTNKCEKTVYVEVGRKACLPEEEYAFSRNYDEYVEIEAGDIEGKLTIFSAKNGEPISYHYLDGKTFRWYGKDKAGQYLPEGYYPTIINTKGGKIIKTGITITP